jgi:hypothetical protein
MQKCHEHGHLFCECPQNISTMPNRGKEEKDGEGFIKIPNKRKVVKKGAQQIGETSKKSSNSFQALAMKEQMIEKGKEPDQSPVNPDPETSSDEGKPEEIPKHQRIEKTKIPTLVRKGKP